MKIQEGVRADGSRVWILLDGSYRPVEPVTSFIKHLDAVQRSPNTIRAYIYDLKTFWEFLDQNALDWTEISFENLSDFALSLKLPAPGVIPLRPSDSSRTEKTINRIVGTVSSFYQFHEKNSAGKSLALTQQKRQLFSRYKSFLHHAKKSVTSHHRALKLKEPKRFPGCLTKEQVKELILACQSLRDRLLLSLLYESGLRIGEALELRHEDMQTGERNVIRVVPRNTSSSASRAKSGFERHVDVSVELMRLYSLYLIEEYPVESGFDHIFLQSSRHSDPRLEVMSYASVDSLFRRLRRKTGIYATPHLFRHTHATELLRARWNAAYVQKRLGHAHIQTTINTYTHLDGEDLEMAYREYIEEQRSSNERC